MLKSDLEACSIEIKELKQGLDHSSYYKVFSPPCEVCGTLKSKLLHATKENSELKQKVTYLPSHLESTIVSEKMIEDDLSRVEESATKSTYKLDVGFERCEDKGEKSASKFVPSSNYHKEEESLKPTKTHYPSNPMPSFNPQERCEEKYSKSK
jgi:predicted nuclease with TOPRIM domain